MTPTAPATGRSSGADSPARHQKREENDPRLVRWLSARSDRDAESGLIQLVDEVALPVIRTIVRGKFGRASNAADVEDVTSEARLQLLRYLQRLREDSRRGAVTPPIDLPAYVATITYSAWANHLRRRHPARAMLLNRLRYLLENRSAPQGFALWPGEQGERLAGFAAWQDAEAPALSTPRHQWLLTDARAAAADAFGGRGFVPSNLAALTAGLLNWLGGPLELSALTRALVEVLGLGEPASLPSGEAEDPESAALDPGFSPHETLRWKEYLSWLWRQAVELPLGQRTAFLCHSSLLREMELGGLTSIRAAATALELPPVRMAAIWSRLPLNDADIAELLGSPNSQQVANLRKAARAVLGRAWRAASEK